MNTEALKMVQRIVVDNIPNRKGEIQFKVVYRWSPDFGDEDEPEYTISRIAESCGAKLHWSQSRHNKDRTIRREEPEIYEVDRLASVDAGPEGEEFISKLYGETTP